jgi:glycerol-3-phosphate dehydrogenase (NAD(P)+)
LSECIKIFIHDVKDNLINIPGAVVGEQVLIIGYGEMGHAMEHLLGRRHDVVIWNRSPVAGLEPVDLDAAAGVADIVIYCIPVVPLAEVAGRVFAQLRDDGLSLIISKGLDAAGRTAPQALQAIYGEQGAFAAVYGPMIAEEISAGRPGFAQLGVNRSGDFSRVAQLFAGSSLYLEASTDIAGIAWSSVFKNIYAIMVGAADALGLGDNVRGYLIVSAIDEMRRIVTALGGSGDTCLQLAGLGDLVTTATSPDSHHHALGGQLARGETGALSGEGIHALEMIGKRELIDAGNFPLYDLVRSIVADPAGLEDKLTAVIAQQFRHP